MRTVPRFKLEFDEKFKEEFAQGCKQILSSDHLTNGPWVEKFEQEFAKFVGAKYAVAVGSGTDALEAALLTVNVKGKRVILPSNTFIATAVAVLRAGGEPWIMDIEPDTFSLDPDALDRSIDRSVGAVIVVHVGGLISAHIERIRYLCTTFNVPLIEDAAHAHGSCSALSSRAGVIGNMGCFSFFPTKVMTTGEGGIVTTNDDISRSWLRILRQFGALKNGWLPTTKISGNLKMTEFQGLLGCLELKRVEERTAKRNALAAIYLRRLSHTEYQVVWPNQLRASWYKLIVRIPTRLSHCDALRKFCQERGVDLAGEVYRYPLHKQQALNVTCECPVADEFSRTHICPPLYPEMTEDDVNYVCDVLLEAMEA